MYAVKKDKMTTGIGSAGGLFLYKHQCHSLLQGWGDDIKYPSPGAVQLESPMVHYLLITY